MLTRWLLTGLFSVCMGFSMVSAQSTGTTTTPFFRITVVDEETGRGIPLVKLTTTNKTDYWTDSAGVVAFSEPEMMGADVQLMIESYGYSYPRNMFGQAAVGFNPKPGGSLVIKMKRENIAQRLYRVTGTDIYRDSVMLGDKVPVTQDPSRLPVTGMDSVVTAIYKGKMHWIWGDTGITATNLGNFRSTGATSDLPGKGGLDPDEGVYLTFFRQEDDRIQGMVNTDHNLTWMGGMHVVKDASGKEHLFASYSKIKGMLTSFESGLLEFNDATNKYDIVWAYPKDANLHLGGNHFRHTDKGVEYFYQMHGTPDVRCRADIDSVKDIYSYEGLTCLKEGSNFDGSEEQLMRDKDGHLVWGWRKNTSPVGMKQFDKLFENKRVTAADAPYALRDASSSETVLSHGGSVYWNEHRQRWTMIMLQNFGTSWLGEVWYFEADKPEGPWAYGQKIITHTIFRNPKRVRRVDEAAPEASDTYGFYNVKQHPEFSKENGRFIYLEGTYTMQFSGAKIPTPRYDYNQIMYKVDLDDSRMRLPVPVYRVAGKKGGYYTKENLPEGTRMDKDVAIAFFAPDRERAETFPVYAMASEKGVSLSMQKPAGEEKPVVAFYAAAPEVDVENTSPTLRATAMMYEYTNSKTGERFYSVKEKLDASDSRIDEVPADVEKFVRAEKPVCRVWPNLIRFNPYRLQK